MKICRIWSHFCISALWIKLDTIRLIRNEEKMLECLNDRKECSNEWENGNLCGTEVNGVWIASRNNRWNNHFFRSVGFFQEFKNIFILIFSYKILQVKRRIMWREKVENMNEYYKEFVLINSELCKKKKSVKTGKWESERPKWTNIQSLSVWNIFILINVGQKERWQPT